MRPLTSLLRPNGLANGVSTGALTRASRWISSIAAKGLLASGGPKLHYSAGGHELRRGTVRTLVTLAIETSCDDTCVAVLERHPSGAATLHFNGKVTSDSRQFGGIHPTVATAGHTQHLAPLVRRALAHLPAAKPDFVTVTRGPGMPQSLAAGLNTAKGLALAWDVPLLGVNHMQAHALTPRLVTALAAGQDPQTQSPYTASPSFPFLSLLVSGGHTMLVLSQSATAHRILVPNLSGLALGDMLDKTARALIPQADLDALPDTMYAAALESFAASSSPPPPPYSPPLTRRDEIAPLPVHSPSTGELIATLTPPLSTSRRLAYDFTGLGAQVARAATTSLSLPSRRALALATMRLAFEHLATRIILCLDGEAPHSLRSELSLVRTLVVSGGVARNRFLRAVLRSFLTARGYGPDRLVVTAPPPELCTDNAAMVAWAGVEMWDAGWSTALDVVPLRKWPVDPAEEGGILGVEGWVRRDGFEDKDVGLSGE